MRQPLGDGQLDGMRLAVNSCLEDRMRAEPRAADDARWSDLYDFLEDQASVESAWLAELAKCSRYDRLVESRVAIGRGSVR